MDMEELSSELISIYDKLMRFSIKRTGNETEAEDLVAEVILNMLSRATIIPRESVEGYAINSIKNKHIDNWRRRNRERAFVALPTIDFLEQPDPLIGKQLQEAYRALESLGANCIKVLRLHFFHEFTYDEMAKALDIPTSTVGSQMHRCREKLALKLDEMGIV